MSTRPPVPPVPPVPPERPMPGASSSPAPAPDWKPKPKFTVGAILGIVSVALIAIINQMASLGIKPKGFVGMGITLLGALAGVYAGKCEP